MSCAPDGQSVYFHEGGAVPPALVRGWFEDGRLERFPFPDPLLARLPSREVLVSPSGAYVGFNGDVLSLFVTASQEFIPVPGRVFQFGGDERWSYLVESDGRDDRAMRWELPDGAAEPHAVEPFRVVNDGRLVAACDEAMELVDWVGASPLCVYPPTAGSPIPIRARYAFSDLRVPSDTRDPPVASQSHELFFQATGPDGRVGLFVISLDELVSPEVSP